jgi:hypothetical protein
MPASRGHGAAWSGIRSIASSGQDEWLLPIIRSLDGNQLDKSPAETAGLLFNHRMKKIF